MNFEILDEAEREVQDITDHYEAIRPGLEGEFREDLARTFQRLVKYPKLHPADAKGFRRANLRFFPYYVAYVVDSDATLVLAVSHAKRKPKYWSKRLKRV
jgi:plasmid stabilization system protein ParE